MAIEPRRCSHPSKTHLKYVVERRDHDGKRRRRYFRTRREAKVYASQLEADLRGAGRRAAGLSDAEKLAAVAAIEALRPHGVSLTEVVRQFVAEREAEEKLQSFPVIDAVEEFLAGLSASNLRPRTTKALANELRRFAEAVGEGRGVARITDGDCRAYCFGPDVSPRTSTNRRARLNRLFGWLLKQGHITVNPVENVETPRNETPRPDVLSPQEARRLMQAAAELAGGKWAAYTALCLFCGLRPEAEAERLDWRDVSLSERTVVIGSGKLRQRRVVEVPENAIAWLAPHSKASGPVAPSAKRSGVTFRDVREAAGIDRWQPDLLRHSAISYRLAHLGDEGKVASWAGNSPTVLHAHYKALVGAEEARTFFAIVPDGSGELIRFGDAEGAEVKA